jgi:lysozyme
MIRFNKKAVAGGAAAAIALATLIIAPWEGYYSRTYLDIVKVATVCYGETDKTAVAEGRRRAFGKDECLAMLEKSLVKYDDGMMTCLHRPVPVEVRAVFLSTAYNIGIAGFCGSSMARRWNAGDAYGACDALLMWNRAGGRVVKGLDNRRKDERRLCREAVAKAGRAG